MSTSRVEPGALPAIIVGRGHTGLGMLRALRMAGIEAFVACPRGDLVTHSRWYRPVPGPHWNGDPGEDAFAILEQLPDAVLIPGADDAAWWMAELPANLTAHFPVSSSSRATLEILQDKSRFAQYLQDKAMPHPRTFSLRAADDIASIPFAELDRVFVKPSNSQEFTRRMGVKALAATGRADVERIWKRLRAEGLEAMVQEYIPGAPSDHYFIDGFRDRNGDFTGLFARRRLRIHPPDFGNSSYCESIPLDDVANALANLQQLLSDLSYRGIFSAEFKRDARDGVFRILEVNTRAWWYVEFAARCGVNVCRMAYDDAQGRQVQAARTYRDGIGCVNLSCDIKAVTRRKRDRPWRVLSQWARAHFLIFRWDDPKPVPFWIMNTIRYRWRTLRGSRRTQS